MESVALAFSAAGRAAPKPFTIGVVVVYVAAFLSQLLLVLPAGLVLFALVQASASWAWFCLHANRLRDAGRPIAPAIAVTILYGLAVVLLMLLVAVDYPDPGGAAGSTPSVAANEPPLPALLLTVTARDPGLFAYVAMGLGVLVVVPMLLAIGFSIWAGSLPSAPAVGLEA